MPNEIIEKYSVLNCRMILIESSQKKFISQTFFSQM